MVRIASFNVENLFARPRAFDPLDWAAGRPAIDACKKVNTLMANATYSASDKIKMRDLLVELDIYSRNSSGAVRKKRTAFPRWAWLRKNRGRFDMQPTDSSKDVVITADGRSDWIGWVELATEPVNESGTRMTARVIKDVDADIIGIVEAEDRPSMVRFNKELLGGQYDHVMLVDGNDERGIDVGIMTKTGFDIESIRSNVDLEDNVGEVFSRDCPEYSIKMSSGTVVHVLVNHFKSQSGGGGPKRQRQALAVKNIAQKLVSQNQHVVVMGDLNEGSASVGAAPTNLTDLFSSSSPLVDCYSLPGFDVGARPGTYDSCGIRNRLDYILISPNLVPAFAGGSIFRNGLWGSRVSRPDKWATYVDMGSSMEQASDHAAVYIDLNI